MTKAGDEFENLAKKIFDTLAAKDTSTVVDGPKVFLEGKDGKREFDLVLRSQVAGFDLLTVVECRDYRGRLDVSHLDGFVSKMEDVNANKGILISRNGFSNKAKKKANRLGVDLIFAQDAQSVADHLAEFGLALPVAVHHIEKVEYELSSGIFRTENQKVKKSALCVICDRNINEYLIDHIESGKLDIELKDKPQILRPKSKDGDAFIRDVEGKKIYIPELEFTIKIKERCIYFGYLNQLPNSAAIFSEDGSMLEHFYDTEDFRNGEYKTIFNKFGSMKDIPKVLPIGFMMGVLVTPRIELNGNKIEVQSLLDRG